MNYSEMSDVQIEVLVAQIQWPEAHEITIFAGECVIWDTIVDNRYYRPLSDWRQGGEIIEGTKINIVWGYDDEWGARTVHTPTIKHKNPLRAAMIVFLMMNEGRS